MFDFLLILIALLALATIVWMVMRKFPILATLDTSTIPREVENRQKQQIISLRLKRLIMPWFDRLGGRLRPVLSFGQRLFAWLYDRLHQAKENMRQEVVLPPEEVNKQIERLVDDAEALSRQDDFEVAEKKLIEAIALDSKNIEAFRALAHLYFEKKDYEEAKQTFEHVLKLSDNDEDAYEGLAAIASQEGDYPHAKEELAALLRINNQKSDTYFNLALLCETTKDFHESLANIKKALALEANNPRYLDLWLRISIIIKDKVEAYEAFSRLKEVNPENQKLAELKAEIDEL
jgi:tetratricopeptide (TPR) repeat protein